MAPRRARRTRGTKIWLEALTSKQALMMARLHEELSKLGMEPVVTCREYDYVVSLLRRRGIEPIVIGQHGKDVREKALRGLERALALLKLWLKEGEPALHISLTSPEGAHVAFRLGIPVLLLTDSPHSIYVNRLTLPLAERIVAPRCTPAEAYGPWAPRDRFVYFDGVFELMWVRTFEPRREVPEELGLEPGEYVVVRPEERRAAYYRAKGSEPTSMLPLIRALLEADVDVVVFPRYEDQREYLRRLFGGRVVMPETAVDAQSLAYYALAVVTGGGTMATEASLMGTPAITTFPERLPLFEYVRQKGFPLIHEPSIERAARLLLEIVRDPDSWRVDAELLLRTMEDPTGIIIREATRILKAASEP